MNSFSFSLLGELGFTLSGFTSCNTSSFFTNGRFFTLTSSVDLIELLSSSLNNGLSVLIGLSFILHDSSSVSDSLFSSFSSSFGDGRVKVSNGVLQSDSKSVELSLRSRAGVQVGVLDQRGDIGGRIFLESYRLADMVNRDDQFLSLAGDHDELFELLFVKLPGSRLERLEQSKDLRDGDGRVDVGESLEESRQYDGLQTSNVFCIVLLFRKGSYNRCDLLDGE